MSDEVWSRPEPQSPCTKVCVIHEEAGICVGCLRKRAEIAGWSRMSFQERQDVLDALPDRASLLKKRRGGRKARRT